MAIRAELADGRVLEFPDDTDQSVIDQTVKRAIENPYSTRSTKELEAVSAAPSTLRDINESAAMGLAGGIKGLSDIFGVGNVVSKKMEELQREAYGRLTPERQRELAIEDELARRASEEGMLAEAKQAGRSFLRSPIQQGIGAAFSSAPIIGATALAPEVTIPAMLTGRGVGALVGRTALANAPAIGVGAAMGVGSQKGQDYERVKEAMLEQGKSPEEAEAAAQRAAEYSMQNAARQAAAGVAGGAEGALGIESLLGRAGRARAGVRGGPEAPTWGRAATQSTLGEAVPEAIQNVVGTVGSNVALQQAGIDTDLFKGAAGEAVSGALAAALMGSAVTPLQMRQLRQEFARDQLEKQMEEQKKAFDALQKQQEQIAQTKEQLGTQEALALPAPAPKVEEQDPLQNPLGNLTKAELGPEVVGYIEQYRSANGMPLLNSYSIEDVKDAMTQVNPEGEAAALDSLVAAKSGYQPDVTYSAQDVLNAATDKVDTTTQGFRDFLNRTTGNSDLNTMSQPQLYAAFKALESVPVGQGLTILPEGSNASRFTEAQMDKGLDKVQAAIQANKENPAVTPEQAIGIVKKATKLKQDRDAASLLKQLVKENHLDIDADGNFIAPTKIENLPAGYTLEKGTFKQSDQQLYGVLSDGKPLEGVDTYTNPEDAQAKVDALNKTREKQAEVIQQQIKKAQDQIDQSQQELDALEAAGEGGTAEYKKAKAKHDAMTSKIGDNNNELYARYEMFKTPLTMGPMGMKQVNRTGYTLFKDGVFVSTHPTTDAALDSLIGTMPEEEVTALAQDKTPGMRTVARKARQRIEGKERIAEKEAEEAAIPEEEKVARAEEKQKVQEFAEKLSAILTKFGLGDVKLEIIKGMEDEGSYAANLIKIALDQNIDDAIGVLRHESIHALKALGFFSPQQLAALERMAKEKWINQYLKGVSYKDDMTRYDAYKQQFEQEAKQKGLAGADAEAYVNDALVEEAIADAFRAFGNKPPPGMLASIINKIKQFFDRLKRALGAAGYETAEDIFGKIERGELKPEFGAAEGGGKKPSLANAWKATPAEIKQAETYEEKNGILPYVSEGRLNLPTQIEKKSIKTADKYGLYEFDPVLNIPLNKDGTVTVYFHTTKEEAKKINASKTIPSNGKARIYLTNESNGAPILKNRGNFDQTLDGSTVLLNIDPSVLQVDQNYDNGRIDFFVPMAQGEYFNRKMRMASIQKSRKEAIVETFSYKEHEDRITAALAEYNGLDTKGKRAKLKQARDILKKEHNVGTLLTENGKLEKTRLGDFDIEGYDGKSIASMGLGMASAQQISDKVSTCNRSAICEGLCLGETSGGNFLYGGAAAEDVGDIEKSAFRAAARMFQYLKTEALIVHPEEFAIALQAEIDSLKRWSNKNDYDPAIRLNVTSDFKPSMFAGLIDANPDVMFYDYTKLNGDPIADNHHLTYSSTGFGQVINGEPVFFKNKAGQYDHNWAAVRARLDEGYGVAMAFSSKSALPKFLRDEETGKTYQIWDGDLYDARFLDPKAEDGVTGQIVGLRNKAATLKEKTAAAETGGFFIDYDPKRDGDTVVVPDQSQFKGKKVVPIAAQPVEKKSLRAPEWVPQNIWDLHEKSLAADEKARYYNFGPLKANATKASSRLIKAVSAYIPDDEQAQIALMVRMNEESSRREGETEKKSLRAPETKEFKQWFGRSKIVNADGTPKVMYHGTALDFGIFEPKQANAIFLTDDPDFANFFAQLSEDRTLVDVAKRIDKNSAVKRDLITRLVDSAIEDKRLGTKENSNGLFNITREEHIENFMERSLASAMTSVGIGQQLSDIVEHLRETGANIMPVYVRAENPFDYQNPRHIARLKQELDMRGGLEKGIRAGAWQAIESEEVQEALQFAGFDSFYVKEGDRKNLAVYKSNQIKSAIGNVGKFDIENPDIRKSLRAPDTKEFNDWFDESKVVNKEGEPMVMYHGTARDISEFKPGVAKAIFVSPDPDVGSIYSADSLKWVSENAKDELTEEQQAKAKADAIAAVKEDFSYLSDPAERKQPDYKKLVAKRDAILKDIEKNAFGNKKLSEEALPYLATAVKDYLPVGENIMPLFVRALNPFDYENNKHLDMVIGRVLNFMPESVTTKMEYPEKYLAGLKGNLKKGLYQKIEDEAVQKAIRSLGFDSFYVKEHGAKNLGVYSPVQLKSATGNMGGYDLTNPDIRKSLRPNVPNDIQRRINEKIAVRDEKTWLQNLLSAIVPSESDAFRQAAINRYQRIATREKLAAKEDKIEQYTADMSAEFAALHSDYAAELMASAMGIHDGKGGIPVYRNGMTMIWNDNGKITGPLDIFQPLAKLNDPKVFQDWQFWKSAHRGVRLDVVSGKPTQFGKDDLAEARRLESLYPEGLFKQVDQAWDRYNRGLVDYMVQTGVISRKMGDEWVKHGDYFPFYRQQMDEEAKGPKMFSAISGVKAPKELKGGEGTVGDFFENIIRNTQSAIEAGMKNVAAQRAIDNELKIKGAEEVVGFKGEPKRPTSMTNVVTVLKNGETHYYECVDKLFVEAMKGLNMAEIPGLWLLSAPANWLRSFVTKTPDFILANLLRDSMSAWVTSGANITPVIDTAKGFGAALAGTDPDMKVLFDAGLIGGHEFSGKARETGKSLAKELRKRAGVKTTKEKILTPVTTVWEALEKGSTASDAATRLAVYKDTMAQTGNQAEAIRRAMEIMNFQRKGNSALLRILTAAVPFLNARIQGIDVLYRAGIKPFVDPKNASEYEKAVAKAFLKRGAMMMTLSIMYYMMVRDDEDYLAQEEETRDNNWIIPALGVKIPIPFEVGIIFKTMPERITALMMGNDTGAQFMDSMARNIQSTFGIQLPQAVLPLIEVATGYSFFTHRQITPAGLEDVAKQYQVGPSTSRLAEVLGQFTSMTTATGKSIGLSPIELDHLLKGYTGTMGTYFADAVDVVINANSDIPAASKRFEQMPFIRRFALDPEARGNVTAYYELKNAVDEAVRTSNLLERTGKVEDFVRYQEENMPLLASKDYVNALYKSMKEFNQMKQQIRASGMDADDKRDALLAVEQAEAALVSQIKDYRKMIAQ